MSSTFALPNTFLGSVRRPRLRRQSIDDATQAPVTTEHATTEHATTEHATTEHATTEHATTEHATTEHATTEHATTEHVTTAHTVATEHTPVVVATEPAGAAARPAEMPFLRTPASWRLTGTPVSYLDHVAVAPAGMLAITTRFHLRAEGDEHTARAWQDIRTAKGAAKLLEITLGDDEVPVRPVLVIWGPGAPDLENGYLLVKGVYVIDPARPELWAHLFDTPAIDESRRAGMVESLRNLELNSTDAPIAVAC